MALFSTKPKTTKKPTTKKSVATTGAKKTSVSKADHGRLATMLKGPWLSEKALLATGAGVYVFGVPAEATKTDVAAAIEQIYKVVPTKVRMVNLPAKKVSLRTRRGHGTRARRHKAYVYLAKGDSIQF